MKAVLCKAYGPASSLSLEETTDPVAGDNEVVIDVHAAGVNFPDTLIIEGKYQVKPEFPFSPGGEAAGVVSSVVNFGAFVDLGGMDGLVHVSELSWQHVNHPSEVVNVGDEVQVKVLEVDRDRERISLSIRETLEDPWDVFSRANDVGDIVDGTVTKTVPFGAFVSVTDGVEGLVRLLEHAAKFPVKFIVGHEAGHQIQERAMGTLGGSLKRREKLSGRLADRGANITDLATRVIGGADTPVYAMLLDVTVPSSTDAEAVRTGLEQVAGDLGVEVSIHPVDTDIL